MRYILLAILLVFILSFTVNGKIKEGLEQDYMELALECLYNAKKDDRMTPYQLISLDDAIRYGEYIKNI